MIVNLASTCFGLRELPVKKYKCVYARVFVLRHNLRHTHITKIKNVVSEITCICSVYVSSYLLKNVCLNKKQISYCFFYVRPLILLTSLIRTFFLPYKTKNEKSPKTQNF